ncbi:unnamed protein product [Linum tenue]|nr:unnamed protein product [Linum tenue]
MPFASHSQLRPTSRPLSSSPSCSTTEASTSLTSTPNSTTTVSSTPEVPTPSTASPTSGSPPSPTDSHRRVPTPPRTLRRSATPSANSCPLPSVLLAELHNDSNPPVSCVINVD